MADFRLKYGVARGPVVNFYARSDNVFTSTDATPDVTDGNLFYSNNASATSITHFDISGQNVLSEHWGKEIRVVVLDNNTTLVDGAQLRLKDGVSVTPLAGTVLGFAYANSVWYESYRSYNTAGAIVALSGALGTTGILSINPAVPSIVNLTGTSSSMTYRGMVGGYTGQRVTFTNAGSSVTFITNSAGATDSFVVSTVAGVSSIVTGSISVTFVRAVVGTTAKWHEAGQIA